MSFTDQKQRIATEEEVKAPWCGRCDGSMFRCHLCGHKFQVGDKWRWVYSDNSGVINFLTCDACDGPDVLQRFIDKAKRFRQIKDDYWWMEL